MKKIALSCLFLSALLVMPSLLADANEASAKSEAAAVSPVQNAARNTERLLTALRDGDRSLFLENGSAQLKAAMTEKVFAEAKQKLDPILNRAATLDFLGSLDKGVAVVYLYRLRPDAGGIDSLVTTSMSNGEVTGFFVN